jgi:hypothetical protein
MPSHYRLDTGEWIGNCAPGASPPEGYGYSELDPPTGLYNPVVWDGDAWVGADPPPVPAPTLEEAKVAKLQSLDQWQYALTQTYEWQGHVFQTDAVARERMTSIYPMALAGKLPEGFQWRLLNDIQIPLSNTDFANLYESIIACHQSLIYSGFHHKDTIKTLTTIEAVEAYEFVVLGVPDG